MRYLYEHRGTRWAFYVAHWLGLDDEEDRRNWVYGALELAVVAAMWLVAANALTRN